MSGLLKLVFLAGYSYPVDWWSLGVVAYEMRSNTRPFVLHSHTPLVEIKNVLNTSVHYPHYWSHDFIDLLQKVRVNFSSFFLKSNHSPVLLHSCFASIQEHG